MLHYVPILLLLAPFTDAAVKMEWDVVIHSYYPSVVNGGIEKPTVAFE